METEVYDGLMNDRIMYILHHNVQALPVNDRRGGSAKRSEFTIAAGSTYLAALL